MRTQQQPVVVMGEEVAASLVDATDAPKVSPKPKKAGQCTHPALLCSKTLRAAAGYSTGRRLAWGNELRNQGARPRACGRA